MAWNAQDTWRYERMLYGSRFSPPYRLPTVVKHRVFVSYHHGGDQFYYDAFSRAFHDTYDVIYDNSLERKIESDNVDYVIQKIRDNYITSSSCTIVLVGSKTWGRKFVDWEIKATLDKEHGLIGVRLPTAPVDPRSGNVIVPDRLHENIVSGFAQWLTWGQITASAAQLEQYVAIAKARSTRLIANTGARRLRND